MAKKRPYDETLVCNALSRKAGISVDRENKTIEVLKYNDDVGNKSWGKLDYLRNYCGYHVIVVSVFSRKRTFAREREERVDIHSKAAKREGKINMSQMAKRAMKSVRAK